MKKLFFSFFSVLILFPALAQQDANLRLNPEKNKTYRFRSFTKQTVIQTVSGNQQTIESEVLYSFTLKMMDATSDFIVAEVHLDTISTKTNQMGRIENISSVREGDIKSSEPAEVMSAIMSRLSRAAIFARIDYTGQPLEILNHRMLSEMILKDTSIITISEPQASALKTQIAATVSEGNLKTMIKSFTWHLPGNKVAKGGEWRIADQVNSGGMLLTVNSAYRLSNITGSIAAITVESEIRPPENAPAINSGGATVMYNSLRGMNRSNLLIDTSTGLLTENKSRTRITGNLAVSGPGFSMEIPMDISGETIVTALK